jgi:hypothetical protein
MKSASIRAKAGRISRERNELLLANAVRTPVSLNERYIAEALIERLPGH